MGFSEQFDTLQKRTAEAKSTIDEAATESRAQLQQRIDQAQVDLDLAKKDAQQKASDVEGRAESSWAKLKADAAAKVKAHPTR